MRDAATQQYVNRFILGDGVGLASTAAMHTATTSSLELVAAPASGSARRRPRPRRVSFRSLVAIDAHRSRRIVPTSAGGTSESPWLITIFGPLVVVRGNRESGDTQFSKSGVAPSYSQGSVRRSRRKMRMTSRSSFWVADWRAPREVCGIRQLIDRVVLSYQPSYSGAPPLRSGCARLQQLQQQQALPSLMQLVHLSVRLRDGSARSSSVRSDAVMRLTTRLAARTGRPPPSSMLSLSTGLASCRPRGAGERSPPATEREYYRSRRGREARGRRGPRRHLELS